MTDFKEKVVVITGGNYGIGYATAKELIEKGARVIIIGKHKKTVEDAAFSLQAFGLVADPSNFSEMNIIARKITNLFGPIDMLLINACSVLSTHDNKTNGKKIENIMNYNFNGTYTTLSMFIPIIKDKGSIVFLATHKDSISNLGNPVMSSSVTSLNSLLKITAVELAERKIRVNAISPIPMDFNSNQESNYKNEVQAKMLTDIPLPKIVTTEELVKLITYILNDSSMVITGSVFLIDR